MVSTKDSSRRTADSIKKSLSAISECSSPGLEACCGHWCCPQNYFRFSILLTVFTISFATLLWTNRNMANPLSRQWQDKECFSSVECRTWSTGNFCCDGVCCDHLPEEDYGEYQVPWKNVFFCNCIPLGLLPGILHNHRCCLSRLELRRRGHRRKPKWWNTHRQHVLHD